MERPTAAPSDDPSPPTLEATPAVGLPRAPAREDLDRAIHGRTAFGQAQGTLAQLSGGTVQRAGLVLLHFGGQLGLPSAEAAATFFLACSQYGQDDKPTRDLIGEMTAAAAPTSDRRRRQTVSHHTGQRHRVTVSRQLRPAGASLLDGGAGVAVQGELDMASAPLLAAAIEKHRRSAGEDGDLVLDLHQLTFCDVVGFHALAAAHRRVEEGGGRVFVVPPAELSPRRLLHLAVARGWMPAEFARA
jgi:anti-anti-sigma factor